MWFTTELSGVLEMQNFTSAVIYSSQDGLTPDTLSPPPESVLLAFGRTFFFGRIDYQIFLALGLRSDELGGLFENLLSFG